MARRARALWPPLDGAPGRHRRLGYPPRRGPGGAGAGRPVRLCRILCCSQESVRDFSVGQCCARYVWLTRGLSRAVSVSHVHVSATMYVCMYLPHHSTGIVSFVQSYSSYLETRNATTRFSAFAVTEGHGELLNIETAGGSIFHSLRRRTQSARRRSASLLLFSFYRRPRWSFVRCVSVRWEPSSWLLRCESVSVLARVLA